LTKVYDKLVWFSQKFKCLFAKKERWERLAKIIQSHLVNKLAYTMFRFKNLKKKQPKSASVSKEIEDLEKFVMTAMKIDAVVLDAFDRRAQLRLNDFEERLGHLEARMACVEAFFDYPSPSEFPSSHPSSCDLGGSAAGAAAAPARDEGQVTFEASVAPQRPPKWSQASIEAFLAAQAQARGEPKEEWMRLAIGCTPASSDSLSGQFFVCFLKNFLENILIDK